jgi:hypothetical protein
LPVRRLRAAPILFMSSCAKIVQRKSPMVRYNSVQEPQSGQDAHNFFPEDTKTTRYAKNLTQMEDHEPWLLKLMLA